MQKEQTANGKIYPPDFDVSTANQVSQYKNTLPSYETVQSQNDKEKNNSSDYNVEKKGISNSAFADETTEL